MKMDTLLHDIDPSLRFYRADQHEAVGGQERFSQMDKCYNEHLPPLLPQRARKVLTDFKFAFVHNWSLNAYCTTRETNALVAQNVGSVLLLHDMCHGLLSHPHLLSDLGKSRSERVKYTHIRGITDARTLSDPENSNVVSAPRYTPYDPERKQFADLVAQLALDCMFLHEFAHVVAGHPGYKRDHLAGRAQFQAFGTPVAVPEHYVLRYHALEFDADWFAFRELVPAVARNSAISADVAVARGDIPTLFRALSLAALILFTLDPHPAPFAVYCRERDHPHPYFRFLMLEHCGAEALELNNIGLVDEWTTACRQALKDGDLIASLVGFGREFFQDILIIGPQVNERVEEVYAAHRTLLNHLKNEGRDLRLDDQNHDNAALLNPQPV